MGGKALKAYNAVKVSPKEEAHAKKVDTDGVIVFKVIGLADMSANYHIFEKFTPNIFYLLTN